MGRLISFSRQREVLDSALRSLDSSTHDIEVEALHSGLVSKIGLVVLDLAQPDKSSPPREVRELLCRNSSKISFDFGGLLRDEIVKTLDHCCGLGLEVCGAALEALENEAQAVLDLHGRAELEGIGLFEREGGRIVLHLDERIAFIKNSKGWQ